MLPFANSSPDADNEFFTDGVMEDILTDRTSRPRPGEHGEGPRTGPQDLQSGLLAGQLYAMARRRIASGDENPRLPYSLAAIHALRGEDDEALSRLARAEELGWVEPEWPAMEPAMEGLRDDPRFQEILSWMEARQREMRETVVREGW